MNVKAKEKPSVPAVQSAASVPALPDFMQAYTGPIGTEDIDNADISIPRLKIGQAMSDEVKAGAVKDGALFLNVTGQTLWEPGQPPVTALIVAQSKEYILWRPRNDEAGGILARARAVRDPKTKMIRYKWDKPNEEFAVKVGGKVKVVWQTKEYIDQDGLGDWGSEIPGDKSSGIAATAHHNYLVLLPSAENAVAAMSMSKSGVKVAKNLNTALKMGNARVPVCWRKFALTTISETADGNEYKNWQVKPAGHLGADDSALAALAMEYHENFKTGAYVVDQSDAAASTSEDAPF